MLLRMKKASEVASSEITPKETVEAFYKMRRSRRDVLKGLGAVGAAAALGGFAAEAMAETALKTVPTNYKVSDRDTTPEAKAKSYNNFYEFGTDKGDPARHAGKLKTRPWTVKVEGLVKTPKTVDIDAIMAYRPIEERV